MYITTNRVLPRGTRVRVELCGPQGSSAMVEAVVARSDRSKHQIRPDGLGVRFLTREEVLGEVAPELEALLGLAEDRPPSPADDLAIPGTGGAGLEPDELDGLASLEDLPSLDELTPIRGSAAVGTERMTVPMPIREAPPSVAPLPPPPTDYPVRFETVDQFRQIYERDLSTGGLFVPSQHLAPLNSLVTIELQVADVPPLLLRARVVHLLEPRSGSPVSGMGVEILDLDRIRGTLEALLQGS